MLRTTNEVITAMTLNRQATSLAASRGESSSLSVLVHRVADPVDSGVVSNSHMCRVDKDDLVVLVGGILVYPVRVQDTHVSANTASTLLSNTLKVSAELKLVDTSVLGLTVNNTLVVGSLAATTADSNTVNRVTLFGLVTELVGLVSSSRVGHSLDLLALTVLPSANAKQETHHVRLLLAPHLFHILVGSHFLC